MVYFLILGSLMLFIGQEKAKYKKKYIKNRTTEAISLETFNNVIVICQILCYHLISMKEEKLFRRH